MRLASRQFRSTLFASLLLAAGCFTFPACAAPEEATTQPASSEAPTTQPATTQPSEAEPSELDGWLTRIGERSNALKTFQARVRIERTVGIVGDVQTRYGDFVYSAGPPGRFALHIDRLLVDERAEARDHWFVFDGLWLVERDNQAKLFNKRQVSKPGDENAEKNDPLASGEGPFVLPLRFDKDRLLARFDAALIPVTDESPQNAVGIRLTPREGVRVDVAQVDLWYDRDTLLPTEIHTSNDANNGRAVYLLKQRVDEGIDEKVFSVKEPTERGWRVDVREWDDE